MDFSGKGRPLTSKGMAAVCDLLDVGEPEVWAVLTVEAKAFGFLRDRRPLILYERHIFSRRTGRRFDAANPGVANPTPGGYLGEEKEYPRLAKALTLSETDALASASWGIGQVMGFNHEPAGFESPRAMVEAMIDGEDMQLMAFARYIESHAKCLRGIQQHDWASFAACYNGANFRKNDYDTRLAAAFAKTRQLIPDLGLRTAQAALAYIGIDPGPIDGQTGRRTIGAISDFQAAQRLPVTGILDEETEERLTERAFG